MMTGVFIFTGNDSVKHYQVGNVGGEWQYGQTDAAQYGSQQTDLPVRHLLHQKTSQRTWIVWRKTQRKISGMCSPKIKNFL